MQGRCTAQGPTHHALRPTQHRDSCVRIVSVFMVPLASPAPSLRPRQGHDRGPAAQLLSSPSATARVEAWLQGLLLRLALAGPAGDVRNALLRRRLGWYVADCGCPSTMPCRRLTVAARRSRGNTGTETRARLPSLSAGPAGAAGAAQEEHLLLLRDVAAAGVLLDMWATQTRHSNTPT